MKESRGIRWAMMFLGVLSLLFLFLARSARAAEDDRFKLGNNLLREQQYAEALTMYESFVAESPDHHLASAARWNMANIYLTAKHHSATDVTLSMKNLMGINWDRIYFHQNGLHQAIADLSTMVMPDLTIMDANRILLTNSPSGPGQTRDDKAVITGTDQVAMDAYCTTLLNRFPEDTRHIQHAYQLGIGEMDLKKLNIEEVPVN